jgi:hypothetical protein
LQGGWAQEGIVLEVLNRHGVDPALRFGVPARRPGTLPEALHTVDAYLTLARYRYGIFDATERYEIDAAIAYVRRWLADDRATGESVAAAKWRDAYYASPVDLNDPDAGRRGD